MVGITHKDAPIRILLVDDSALVREGLAAILSQRQQMLVVAEGSNGEEAIVLHREYRPDVTLMDLRMPEMDGLTATRSIMAEYPQARIIVLTTFEGEEDKSLRAGAKAVLLKEAPREQLLATIRNIYDSPGNGPI